MENRSILAILTLTAVALSLVSTVTQVLLVSHDVQLSGRASGITNFCLNHPPEIQVPCNTTLSQNTSFYCQLNISDLDSTQNLTVTQGFLGNTTFNVSTNGTINFTPVNDDVGNHTVIFTVTDDSGCTNNQSNATYSFSVANINDPPFLALTIPDQSFDVDTTLSAFFLNNYFSDPDGDPLNYTSTQPSGITVTILPSSEVTLTSSTCNPDGEYVIFTATDPFNESADSNLVLISVTCAPTPSTGGGSEGGGGGGGGGAFNLCKSEWECQEWFSCLPANIQWRRCYDKNGCQQEKHFKRECNYDGPPPECAENWLCDDWGKCFINNTQERSCQDLNECGTTIVKPPEQQACVYIASCNDGVQNGNETGIDCGGECPACALLQSPLPILGEAGLSTWLLIILILAILITSGVVRYYKSEIAQAMATLGFLMKHRAYKDVLLNAEQRRSLFEQIFSVEKQLETLNAAAVYTTLSELIRGYFRDALDLPLEAIPAEVAEKSKKLSLQPETTFLLTGLFAKLEIVEQEELEYDEYFVKASLEELRTIVCLTSDCTQEEILRPVTELKATEEMSFYDEIFVHTINILRAVQFNQLEAARKEYVKMLSIYDPLSEREKEEIYPELLWTFKATKFQSEITGSKIVKKAAA